MAEILEIGAVRVALRMEEVNIAQMQILNMDKLSNDERINIQLTSRHKRKVGEPTKGLKMLEGFVDIAGVDIGTIVSIIWGLQMLMVVICGLVLISLAKQLSPAKVAPLRLRVVRLVMLGKSICFRCTFSRLATCSTLSNFI